MNLLHEAARQSLSEWADVLAFSVTQHLSGVHQLSQESSVGWMYARGIEIGPNGLAVEVGTWVGGKAIALALGGPRVVAIDTFRASDAQTGVPALERLQRFHHRQEVLTETLQQFCLNITRAGVGDRVVGLVGRSPDVAELFPPASLDLVFLDGDHASNAVAADVAAWGSRVKRGGLLCGHDYEQGSVRDSLIAWIAAQQPGWGPVEKGPDQMWWVRRPHG